MYKIYINDTPLILANLKSIADYPKADEQCLVARYTGLAKSLLNYIDMLEKSKRFKKVYLITENYEKLVEDFNKHFIFLEAAGGIVFNPQAEILAIYRRGFWDLPKGKFEEGETASTTAIREVQEETGLQHLELGPKISSTYHTYRLTNGKRILKQTHWFQMMTDETIIKPQLEEDIEQAIWISPKKFLEGDYPIYNSIRELIQACL